MSASEPLPGFAEEIVRLDAVWNRGEAPRLTIKRRRNGTITRVLTRSDRTELNRAVTVHFTADEWRLIEQAVLEGRRMT